MVDDVCRDGREMSSCELFRLTGRKASSREDREILPGLAFFTMSLRAAGAARAIRHATHTHRLKNKTKICTCVDIRRHTIHGTPPQKKGSRDGKLDVHELKSGAVNTALHPISASLPKNRPT